MSNIAVIGVGAVGSSLVSSMVNYIDDCHISIFDNDCVEERNINNVYGANDIGQPKVNILKQISNNKIEAKNQLVVENDIPNFEKYDLVFDCRDMIDRLSTNPNTIKLFLSGERLIVDRRVNHKYQFDVKGEYFTKCPPNDIDNLTKQLVEILFDRDIIHSRMKDNPLYVITRYNVKDYLAAPTFEKIDFENLMNKAMVSQKPFRVAIFEDSMIIAERLIKKITDPKLQSQNLVADIKSYLNLDEYVGYPEFYYSYTDDIFISVQILVANGAA